MDSTRPLVEKEYEYFDSSWMDSNWLKGITGLVRVRTDMDGSCFFHAVAKAYCKPYIEERLGNTSLNRREFVKNLRGELAEKLASQVDPMDPQSKTYYDTISRGEMRNFGLPEYSLENMQKVLRANEPVDNVFNEFISDVFEKDIYLLSSTKRDVYVTGNDMEILFKSRPSIVILVLPGHYELVGQFDGNLKTIFSPDDPLIRAIRTRFHDLIKTSFA